MDTFSALSNIFGGIFARFRTDPVYLHVCAQGYGPVRSHYAEQRTSGGSEDHSNAVKGDSLTAEGNYHEPEGDDQGTNFEVEPL